MIIKLLILYFSYYSLPLTLFYQLPPFLCSLLCSYFIHLLHYSCFPLDIRPFFLVFFSYFWTCTFYLSNVVVPHPNLRMFRDIQLGQYFNQSYVRALNIRPLLALAVLYNDTKNLGVLIHAKSREEMINLWPYFFIWLSRVTA